MVVRRTGSGTAGSGSDFVASTSTLSWGAGEGGPKGCVVALIDDDAEEGSESLAVALHAPELVALGSPAVAAIVINGTNDSA